MPSAGGSVLTTLAWIDPARGLSETGRTSTAGAPASSETQGTTTESPPASIETPEVSSPTRRPPTGSAGALTETAKASSGTRRLSTPSARARVETSPVSCGSAPTSSETAKASTGTKRPSTGSARASFECQPGSSESAPALFESARVCSMQAERCVPSGSPASQPNSRRPFQAPGGVTKRAVGWGEARPLLIEGVSAAPPGPSGPRQTASLFVNEAQIGERTSKHVNRPPRAAAWLRARAREDDDRR